MKEFRELLFRGQTRKKGEKVFMNGDPVPGNWVYGGVLQGKGDHSIIYAVNKQGKFDDKFPVHTDTLGQYTGLKDKNGKKIFEGDIVLNNHGCLGIIQYFPEHMAFVIWHKKDNTINFIGYDEWASVEVIGNIHDNPELLEVRP